MKPVVRRAASDRDVEAIVDYYLTEGGPDVALGFVDELEGAYLHLSRQPAMGSHRYGEKLGIEGLRSWPLRRFPYIVFYFSQGNGVDIWRVLHSQRDIPAWLLHEQATG